MANKEVKKPEKVKLKLWDTKASQDITGWQLDNNNLQEEVNNKLNSLLPLYEEDSAVKKIDKIDNRHPEFDYVYLPAAIWARAVDWYWKLYNYIANLVNNKKIDEANELLDAIQEMRLAKWDLSDKQNNND